MPAWALVAAESFPVGYGQGIVVWHIARLAYGLNPRYKPPPPTSLPPHLTNPTNPPHLTHPTNLTYLTHPSTHPPPSPQPIQIPCSINKIATIIINRSGNRPQLFGHNSVKPLWLDTFPSSDRGPPDSCIAHPPASPWAGRAVWQKAAFQVFRTRLVAHHNNGNGELRSQLLKPLQHLL